MRLSHSTPLRHYCAALALLVSGIVVGVFGMHVWQRAYGPGFPPPGDFKVRIWEHFERELKLTPEQVVLIRPEFEEAWEQGDAIRRTVEPQMKALFAAAMERVRVHLTPEQRVLLEEFNRRMEERRNRHDGPPPPMFELAPPPPPPAK